MDRSLERGYDAIKQYASLRETMRTLKCDNCASSDFEKISEQEYRCRYCGSIKIAHPDLPESPPK